MSTRGIYTFAGFGERYHVYVHHDNYITGAARHIAAAMEQGLVWNGGRYEPDEFAAGFVAAVKVRPGGVRLARSRTAAADVEFGYRIQPYTTGPNRGGLEIRVTWCDVDIWEDKLKEHEIWKGPLETFLATAEEIERQYEED